MLDREKYDQVISGDAFSSAAESTIFEDIKDWDVEELLELRASIDALLPSTALRDMDLEKEMVLQYHRVVALQTRVLGDDRTPANQLAQVSNAVASTLQQLVTMQTKFHTSERLKEIEGRLIKALDKVPKQYLEEFFEVLSDLIHRTPLNLGLV